MSYDEHLITQAGGDGDVLDKIQRRVDAATEGPWEPGAAHIYSRRPGYPMFLFSPHEDHVDGFGNPSEDCKADARFIANARTDVPYLLALVREQAAKLEAVEAVTEDLEHSDHCDLYHFYKSDPSCTCWRRDIRAALEAAS